MDEMLIDNFVDIVLIDIGVPSAFWVNRDHRPLGTAIHTARVVDAALPFAGEFERFDFLFGVVTHDLRAAPSAAVFTRLALIDAEKYVIFIVVAHGLGRVTRRPPL